MQPPPRKGNYVKFLKNLHTEQLSKLQLKNQHECDLLEDIRQFTIKRSAIEKSYSEALLKISSAYLNKKMPNIPDIKMEGTEEKWNMWSVWRTVLEENEKLARARLAAIEVFQQQIADEAKFLREYKLQINKKSVNQLATVQKELQICVSDVDKTKRSYFDEEHSAHDVRDKARDIEEKLKKKKGSFFQSITSLQKNSARVTSRKEQLEEKSSGARNDYILSLASANAHQNKYFAVDLQTTMTTMENYVYERIAEYLTLMGRTELLTCSATQNSFGKIRDQAQQLTREYNLQCCYLFYPVLKQHIQYDFEPCDNDQVRKITIEHESATATLSREAKIFASRIVRNNNTIKECSRKLGNCITMRDNGHKVDANDPNGPDLETKMEDFKEMIRKAETEKVKSEACLESLRAGGINVDEWLQEAETLGVQEIPRSASSLSMRTDASGQGENASSDSFYDSDNAEQEIPQVSSSAPAEDELSQSESAPDTTDVDVILEQERQKIEQLTAGWDDPTQVDWGHEEEAETIEAAQTTGPIFKCTALYSYTAQNPDELTIVENEQLEVVGEGDGDGWLRARNYRGEEGYVPHNYLDVEHDAAADGAPQAHLTNQISFSSVDYTVDNEEQDAYQDSVQSPDQVSVISAPVKPKSTQLYCIALYDYDASAEDELTFEEGQIIKIINQSAHGVDDGWWEGELDGKAGNFPSLVVEECNENGEPLTEPEDESPPLSAPPLFTPPGAPIPVPPNVTIDNNTTNIVITQSDLDQVASKFNFNGDVKTLINKFDIELSKDQQNVYGKQFQGQPVTVMVEEEEEPPNDSSSVKKGDVKGSNEFGLGVAQIIVTAATPMVEDSEKQFLPAAAATGVDDEVEQNDEVARKPDVTVEKIIKEKTECEIEFKEEDEYDLENDVVVVAPVEIVKEEIKEQTVNIPKEVKKVEPVKQIEKKRESQSSVPGKRESSKKSAPQQQPPPPPTPKVSKPTVKPVKPKLASPPAVEQMHEPEPAVEQMDTQNDNFDDNKFEVNFEEAFGCDAEPPKQVVGGRASIPDELAPHQLARLQDLKESNA